MSIGVVGVGSMGCGLAWNAAKKGYRVSVYDRHHSNSLSLSETTDRVYPCESLHDLVESLDSPRRVLLSLPSGLPTHETVQLLSTILDEGDVVIDTANENYKASEGRQVVLEPVGAHFIDAGVSGGPVGAKEGPCIMVGCDRDVWPKVSPLLTDIALACERVGPVGYGAFTKTVHNGIEYGIMQSIADAWMILKLQCGMDQKQVSTLFAKTNKEYKVWLVDVAKEVLDNINLDDINDEAKENGTGLWTTQCALEVEIPAMTITSSVMMRALSRDTGGRECAKGYSSPTPVYIDPDTVCLAMMSSICFCYIQGTSILDRRGIDSDMVIDLWDKGSVIRTNGLDMKAEWVPHLRNAVAAASVSGVPVPALSASLQYIDSYAMESLQTSLIQGMRNRFGGHPL